MEQSRDFMEGPWTSTAVWTVNLNTSNVVVISKILGGYLSMMGVFSTATGELFFLMVNYLNYSYLITISLWRSVTTNQGYQRFILLLQIPFNIAAKTAVSLKPVQRTRKEGGLAAMKDFESD